MPPPVKYHDLADARKGVRFGNVVNLAFNFHFNKTIDRTAAKEPASIR